MKIRLCLFIVLLSIGWMGSCTTTEIREVEKVYYKTVYKENPFYIEDSTLFHFRDSFDLTSYSYYDSGLSLKIAKWVDELPEKIRDSLINRRVIIQKKYYLKDIQLENYDKVKSAQKLNHKMEFMLSSRIGMLQGIPSVMFTSSIEETNKNQEYLIIKLNRLMY